MTRSREQLDDYAETLVMQPPRAPVPGHDDALALYEEYAREVARSAAPPAARKARTRRKR